MRLKISDFEFEGSHLELNALASLFDLSILLPVKPVEPKIEAPPPAVWTPEPVVEIEKDKPESFAETLLHIKATEPELLKPDKPKKPFMVESPKFLDEEGYRQAKVKATAFIEAFKPFTLHDLVECKFKSKTHGSWMKKLWEWLEEPKRQLSRQKKDKYTVFVPWRKDHHGIKREASLADLNIPKQQRAKAEDRAAYNTRDASMTLERYNQAIEKAKLCINKFIPFKLNDVMPEVQYRSRGQGSRIRAWWEWIEAQQVEQKKEKGELVFYPYHMENQVKVLSSYDGKPRPHVIASAKWRPNNSVFVDPLERQYEEQTRLDQLVNR